jgi:hypothetical protein
MIWLHPFPPPPSPIRKLDQQHRKTEKESHLDDGREEKGVGEEPNYTTTRNHDPLYKSYNTLCYQDKPYSIRYKKGRRLVFSFNCNNFCYIFYKKTLCFWGFILTVERLMGSLHVCHSWK